MRGYVDSECCQEGLMVPRQRRPDRSSKRLPQIACLAPQVPLWPVEAAADGFRAVATPSSQRRYRTVSQHCASLTKCLIDMMDVRIGTSCQKTPESI
jgi:hypothetical protein